MIQYKQKLLKIIRQKRQYHNIEDYTSEESYQDIWDWNHQGVKLDIFGNFDLWNQIWVMSWSIQF